MKTFSTMFMPIHPVTNMVLGGFYASLTETSPKHAATARSSKGRGVYIKKLLRRKTGKA